MLSLQDVVTPAGLTALAQVVMIDLMLAGDNVVVLGTLTAGMKPNERKRVLALGIAIALICLVFFALVATQLLHLVGLVLAGGLLLLWVAWKLFRELHPSAVERGDAGKPDVRSDAVRESKPKSFTRAAVQVALADLSMSLDNVLAVAGAAREHPTVLIFGLAFSVTLIATAASLVARLIERHRWLAYMGLAVIIYVAGAMIYSGIADVGSVLGFRA